MGQIDRNIILNFTEFFVRKTANSLRVTKQDRSFLQKISRDYSVRLDTLASMEGENFIFKVDRPSTAPDFFSCASTAT